MNSNLQRHRLFLLPLTSVCALCIGLAAPAWAQDEAADQQDPAVNVTEFDTVDIAVQDADLAQVLQMLSLQSRKNIISSKNVSAKVTANLYDVTFNEALDAILKVNGFTWVEQGNFIYVYTQEEFNQIQEANRKTTSRTYELNYLSSLDGLEFITPLLSDKGKASARGGVDEGFKPEVTDGGADNYAYEVKIVVNDYPENLDAIDELLNDLDTPPDQVMVEATILQTAVDETNAFGVDFNIIGGFDFTNIAGPLAAVDNLLNGRNPINGFQPADNEAQAIGTRVGNTGGPGGLKIGFVSNDVSVFLRVLDEVTDSTILARPKIMALNRQRAEVLVGARVGYLSTTATETTTTQTVEFLDTGIQLIFRPFISKDGTIRLELKPSVSEASLRTVTDSNGAAVTIPDELTNELTTNVRVRDGQTLVLGGLFKESNVISRRQVPYLGDIPVLGHAFRGQDDKVQRDEIIFLITPTITHDQLLWEEGAQMVAMSELVRIGARNGLLGFSREKMTTSYNQSAVEAANAGDTELAMHHIRKSLRLNSHQPEMIAMQQRLSGDMERAYERSLLERVLRHGMQRDEAQDQSNATPAPTQDPARTISHITINHNGDQATSAKTASSNGRNFAQNADASVNDSSTPAEFSLEPISNEASTSLDDAVENEEGWNDSDWNGGEPEVEPFNNEGQLSQSEDGEWEYSSDSFEFNGFAFGWWHFPMAAHFDPNFTIRYNESEGANAFDRLIEEAGSE